MRPRFLSFPVVSRLVAALALAGALPAAEPPLRVAAGLFDPARPHDLGLRQPEGTKTVTIFRPGDADPHYHNGVALLPFKGRLYAQWQASARDEDSPDTHVLYSWSEDGEHWVSPRALVASGTGPGWHTSGGWWSDGELLVAYINVWTGELAGGGRTLFLTSRDGLAWSAPQPVTDATGTPVPGIIEQDTHALPDGRLLTTFHLQPGLLATPHFTDDPSGRGGWTPGRLPRLPHEGTQSRELEPGWFVRRDGTVVMVFRDQASSFRLLASASTDRGATWTEAVPTAMPDSRSKQSAGNLPDGTAFLVNAPSGNRERLPLAITVSRDGQLFDRAFLLRAGGPELPPLLYPGKYKRPGYHYPKSVAWNDRLCVGYATNKEAVQVTFVPVAALGR